MLQKRNISVFIEKEGEELRSLAHKGRDNWGYKNYSNKLNKDDDRGSFVFNAKSIMK